MIINARGNVEPGRLPVALPVRESLALIFMAMVVALCYANTFSTPFVFDDIPNIVENTHIRIDQIRLDRLAEAAFQSPSRRRPLSNLSFAANYYAGGYQVRGYHFANTLIHIMTAILLYFVIKTAMAGAGSTPPGRSPDDGRGGCWDGSMAGNTATLPFVAAFLWAVHPIQTQSVTYLVQRMNALAAMFYLLACLLFLMAGQRRPSGSKPILYAGCAVSGGMALASKEIAATLPFFLLLLRWFFILDLSWPRIKREMAIAGAMAVIMVVVAFLFLGSSPLDAILAGYSMRPFTLCQRVMTEFRVIVFYVSLLIFPHPSRLNLDHHFIVSASMVDPVSTLFSMVAIVGAGAVAVVLARKDRVVSFCILWYLGNLLIESSVIGLEIIFEHRNYLPSMSLVLLLVWLLFKKIRSGRVLMVIFCGLAGIFSVWTYQRNLVWEDDLTLWEDCARKSPDKARPVNKYGAALERRGRLEAAARAYRRASQADPSFILPYYNLGNVLLKQGRANDAVQAYSKAIHLNPSFVKAHNNRALALARLGRVEEALARLEEVAASPSADAATYGILGALMYDRGNIRAAVEYFFKSLEIDPRNSDMRFRTGNALHLLGRLGDAVWQYREALRMDPSNATIQNNLAFTLAKIGETDASTKVFETPSKTILPGLQPMSQYSGNNEK